MKKFQISGLVVVAILALYGCGTPAPEISAEEVVRSGITNLGEVKSGAFNMSLSADEKDDAVVMKVNAEGEYSSVEKENPIVKMSLDFNAKVKEEKEAVKGTGGLQMADNKIYFSLASLAGAKELPKEMVDLFVGKWWYMDLPADFVDSFKMFGGTELTPEEQQLKDLFNKTDFFKDLKYEGVEKVGPEKVKSYHYTGELDKEALKEYLEKAMNLTAPAKSVDAENEDVADNEAADAANAVESDAGEAKPSVIAEMRAAIDSLNMDNEIWVGVEDKTLRRISGSALDQKGSTVKFDYTVFDFNEPVKADEHKDAQLFDPLSLLFGMSATIDTPQGEGEIVGGDSSAEAEEGAGDSAVGSAEGDSSEE